MSHVQDRGRSWKPASSRYRARYRGPDGAERSKSFIRRIDAERFLTTVESSKLRGDWVDPRLGQTRLEEWAWSWLDSVRPTLKPYTVASYESLLRSRVLPTFGAHRLAALRPSDIQSWIAAMEADGLSPSRIRQAHVVLQQVLDAAFRDGLIARNAAHGVKLPRIQRKEAVFLEPAQVEAIARAMPEPYDLLVRILGTLGLRFGEAAALRRRSVDLLRRRLVVDASLSEVGGRLSLGPTKSHAARSVPLPASLLAALERHLEARVGSDPDAWVFGGPRGGGLRHSAFYNRLWRPTLRQLGLPAVGLHVTRHSAAAAMISAGATPKTIQSVLGHASAAFSLTVYGHLFETDLDALADRLDGLDRDASGVLPRPVRGLRGTTTHTPAGSHAV